MLQETDENPVKVEFKLVHALLALDLVSLSMVVIFTLATPDCEIVHTQL